MLVNTAVRTSRKSPADEDQPRDKEGRPREGGSREQARGSPTPDEGERQASPAGNIRVVQRPDLLGKRLGKENKRMSAEENKSIFRRYVEDRKSTRLNSSHANISYAVFCLKKKRM